MVIDGTGAPHYVFDRAGQDFINCAGGAENVTISGSILAQTYGAHAYYSVHLWTGTAAGTWAGHEGDTVTKDTTNASGFYVGQYRSSSNSSGSSGGCFINGIK
jgi:hypothetical protein